GLVWPTLEVKDEAQGERKAVGGSQARCYSPEAPRAQGCRYRKGECTISDGEPKAPQVHRLRQRNPLPEERSCGFLRRVGGK
ncbi:unnamed protein product, partial [Sphacelaria rigidula]